MSSTISDSKNSTRLSSSRQSNSLGNSMTGFPIGVLDGGVSQRRSSSTARRSVQSKSRRSTSSNARIQHQNNSILPKDDLSGRNEPLADLNTSTASRRTETIDMVIESASIEEQTITDNSRRKHKGLISKSKLIEAFFLKTNTGDYLCKLCEGTDNKQKIHKDAPNSDSNLRSHLAHRHNRFEFLFPSQKDQRISKGKNFSTEFKKKLDQALIYAIIKDGRSFGDFRKKGFQYFLNIAFPGVNYKAPHRSTVKKHIANLYRSYRNKLREQLAGVTDIALTADSWTSSRRTHFICITAHYLGEDFEYQSIVFSFRRFIGRSLGLRIRQFIREELHKLNISEKIRSITTDNGSNIKLATETDEFGFRISCFAHNLHLTVTNGLCLWKKEEESNNDTYELPTNFDDEYTNLDDIQINDDEWEDETNSSVSSDDSNENRTYLMNDDSDDENYNLDQLLIGSEASIETDQHNRAQQQTTWLKPTVTVSKLIQRTRELISIIHRSTVLESFVRDQMCTKSQELSQRDSLEVVKSAKSIGNLVIDICVRWNSTYLMLNRFIQFRSIINEMTHSPSHIVGANLRTQTKLSEFSYNHNDWNWLISLQYVLQPFETATRLLSGRSYQTLCIKRLVMDGLKKFLTTQKSDESIVNVLKSQLLKKYERHCDQTLSFDEVESMMVACFLNPTTHWCLRDDTDFIESARALIKKKAQDLTNQFPQTTITVSSTTTNFAIKPAPTTALATIQSFFDDCEIERRPNSIVSNQIQMSTIDEEIGLYVSTIKDNVEFQSYWKQNSHRLPRLTTLVRRYCISPATSIASESAFSVAGYLQRKHRSSLSPTTLRYSMFLRDHLFSSNI